MNMEKVDISLVRKSSIIYDLLLEVLVCYISNHIMCKSKEIEYFYLFEDVFSNVDVKQILHMLQVKIEKYNLPYKVFITKYSTLENIRMLKVDVYIKLTCQNVKDVYINELINYIRNKKS